MVHNHDRRRAAQVRSGRLHGDQRGRGIRAGFGFAAALLAFLLVGLAGRAGVAGAATATPIPSADRPLIFIRASWAEPAEIAPGQMTRLYLELHNVGDAAANNIVLTISGAHFVPELSSSVKTVAGLQPDEHGTVWQELRAEPNLESGAYPITVEMLYTDESGMPYTGSETVGIRVNAPAATPTPKPVVAGRPQIVIDSFSTEPALPAPGRPFTLTVTLHNSGTGAARSVTLSHGSPSVFAAAGAGSVTAVGAIGWQQTVSVAIPMVVDQTAKAGTNVHPVTLEYDNAAGEHSSSAQSIALQVAEGGVATAPEALVVIESYTTDPPALSPAQAFTLSLKVRNVSPTDARRLTLTLGAPSTTASQSAPIAPLGSGNVRYLPEVKAGDAASVVSQFIVDGNADAGVYVLTVGMEFAGSGDKNVTRSEQISLVVKVRPQLMFNFYRQVPPYQVGQPLDLPIEILNTGRNRVASNTVEVLSEALQITTQKTYVGPLDPGASVTVDAQAMADTPGEKPLIIRVHYIDDFNQPQEFNGEMGVTVAPAPEPSGPGGAVGPDGKPIGDDQSAPEPQRPWYLRLLRGLFGLGSS